jgi:hypothetical protein
MAPLTFERTPPIQANSQKSEVSRAIDWVNIREAYKAYSISPTSENAQRLLVTLPDKLDNITADAEQWSSTLHFIWEQEPFRVLERLIRQGDEFAIRIAFKTTVITDGACTEDLCTLISESIRVNPLIFLEGLYALIKKDEHLVRFILRRDDDIDTYTLYDDPQARVEFNKEIRLRMKSLRTVNRPDLIEIRDYCLHRYAKMLKEGECGF